MKLSSRLHGLRRTLRQAPRAMMFIALGGLLSCKGKAGCLNSNPEAFGPAIISLADPKNYSTKITGVVDDIGSFSLGVVATGDLDGDGIPDVVVGAPAADYNNRVNAGAVHVRRGSATTSTGSTGLTGDVSCRNPAIVV